MMSLISRKFLPEFVEVITADVGIFILDSMMHALRINS